MLNLRVNLSFWRWRHLIKGYYHRIAIFLYQVLQLLFKMPPRNQGILNTVLFYPSITTKLRLQGMWEEASLNAQRESSSMLTRIVCLKHRDSTNTIGPHKNPCHSRRQGAWREIQAGRRWYRGTVTRGGRPWYTWHPRMLWHLSAKQRSHPHQIWCHL